VKVAGKGTERSSHRGREERNGDGEGWATKSTKSTKNGTATEKNRDNQAEKGVEAWQKRVRAGCLKVCRRGG
jgi:hypothetical protein